MYTNINFTEKQKEDICKLYDLFIENGLMDSILEVIPEKEYNMICDGIQQSITAIYAYQNSILGILDNMSNDYNDLNLDASLIQEKLADQDNITLLRDIIDKLG